MCWLYIPINLLYFSVCLFIWQIFTDLLKPRHCSRHLVLTGTLILKTLKTARKEPEEWITISSVSLVLSSNLGQQISNIYWFKLMSMEDIWYLVYLVSLPQLLMTAANISYGISIPPICGGLCTLTWPKLGQSTPRPEEFEFQIADKIIMVITAAVK